MIARSLIVLQRLGRYDTNLCLMLNQGVHLPWTRAFFALVSRLGDGIFWYALMAVLVLADGRAGLIATLHMAAVGLTGLAIYRLLKNTCMRQRPFAVVQAIRPGAPPLDHYSFPSGHTLHAVGFTAVALMYYPALGWVLLPFALLVGLSRMVLGLHYPSDVLAGAAIGAGLALVSGELLAWFW